MSKLLLIDGDVVAYRCGFAVEKTKYLCEDGHKFERFDNAKDAKEHGGLTWSRKEIEPEENALYLVDQVIKDILQRYPDFDPRIWLSPSVGNFRERIATRAKYKGNRDAQLRPVHFKAIREHLCSRWDARDTAGQEADDAIGIDMHANPGSISVSIDKDLLQLPGRHYNWVDKSERVISTREASLNFYTQVLAGDPTDNVPGIEGIGPMKARKLLKIAKGPKDAWDLCLDAYKREYGEDGEIYAIETAKLVYIRRKPEETWSVPVTAEVQETIQAA